MDCTPKMRKSAGLAPSSVSCDFIISPFFCFVLGFVLFFSPDFSAHFLQYGFWTVQMGTQCRSDAKI